MGTPREIRDRAAAIAEESVRNMEEAFVTLIRQRPQEQKQ
jgi:hypothetical protein